LVYVKRIWQGKILIAPVMVLVDKVLHGSAALQPQHA